MAEKGLCVLLAIVLLFSCACAAEGVKVGERIGEAYFPGEKNWVYHFVYSYPLLEGEDIASCMINDTYDMVLNELLQLILPMFANEKTMYFDGKNEVSHDFVLTCNNGDYLSVLQRKRQTKGEEGVAYTMESEVFAMNGEYAGEPLTLRGLVMVGESSWDLSEALLPVLYEEFVRLQQEGICEPAATRDDFEFAFSPMSCFYADEEGNAVFFFPPSLLSEKSFDVPTFTYTREMLAELIGE